MTCVSGMFADGDQPNYSVGDMDRFQKLPECSGDMWPSSHLPDDGKRVCLRLRRMTRSPV